MHYICSICTEVIPYGQYSAKLTCCNIHAHINCFHSYIDVFKTKNADGWLCPKCNHFTYFLSNDDTFNEIPSIKTSTLYTICEE